MTVIGPEFGITWNIIGFEQTISCVPSVSCIHWALWSIVCINFSRSWLVIIPRWWIIIRVLYDMMWTITQCLIQMNKRPCSIEHARSIFNVNMHGCCWWTIMNHMDLFWWWCFMNNVNFFWCWSCFVYNMDFFNRRFGSKTTYCLHWCSKFRCVMNMVLMTKSLLRWRHESNVMRRFVCQTWRLIIIFVMLVRADAR